MRIRNGDPAFVKGFFDGLDQIKADIPIVLHFAPDAHLNINRTVIEITDPGPGAVRFRQNPFVFAGGIENDLHGFVHVIVIINTEIDIDPAHAKGREILDRIAAHFAVSQDDLDVIERPKRCLLYTSDAADD